MRKMTVYLMILLVLFSGCSTKSDEAPKTVRKDLCAVVEGSQLFSGPLTETALGIHGETFLITCIGADAVAIYSTKPAAQADGDNEGLFADLCMTILGRTGEIKKSFTVSEEAFGNRSIFDIDFYTEESLCLLLETTQLLEDGQFSHTYSLGTLDIQTETFSATLDIELTQESTPVDLLCWNQENVLVSFEDGAIACIDTVEKQVSVIQSDLFSPEFVRGENGNLYLVGMDGAYLAACLFSPEDHTHGEHVLLAESTWFQLADGYGGFDFFLSLNSQVYGVDMDAKTLTGVFDGITCGVNLNHVAFFAVGEQLLLCDNITEDFLVDEYVLYSGGASEERVEERTELRLATLSMSSDLQEAVTAFNRTNPSYVISVEDYSLYGDSGKKRLQADFMSGNIPDIINLAGLQATRINSPDYLVDLIPYLEEADILEDLQPAVIQALSHDGLMLTISPNFSLDVLCSFDGTEDQPLTTERFCSLLQAQTEQRFLTNRAVLEILLKNSLNDIIQMETQQVNVELLQLILEAAAAYPSEAEEDSSTEAERLISGELLVSQKELASLRSFRALLFELGEDVRIYGYPGETGDAVLMEANNYLAITKAAREPDAAWTFLNSMLVPDFQTKYLHRTFPIRISCMDLAIQEAEQTDAGFSVKAHTLLDRTLERIGSQSIFDESILDIIYEEAERYFSGDATIEQGISAMASRLRIYLAEQS